MRNRYLGQGKSLDVPAHGFDVMLSHATGPARIGVRSGGRSTQSHPPGSTFFVPADEEGVVLQIESASDDAFADDAQAFIILSPVGTDERINLVDLDVGGHRILDACLLQVVGSTTRISVMAGHDARVPPVVRQVQRLTAEMLQLRSNKLRADESRDIAVCVDGSSSMRPWLDSGHLPALVQAVAGMDHVVGHDDKIDFRVAGSRTNWRMAVAVDVADNLEREFEVIGSVSAVDLWLPPPPGRTWFVVTDHLPASIPPGVALVIVLAGPGTGDVLRRMDPDERLCCLDVPETPSGDPLVLDDALLSQLVQAGLGACGLTTSEGSLT